VPLEAAVVVEALQEVGVEADMAVVSLHLKVLLIQFSVCLSSWCLKAFTERWLMSNRNGQVYARNGGRVGLSQH